MTTILPHLSVDTTRLCDGDDHVNCYFDLQGCNTTNSSIICDDAGGWSASLAFIAEDFICIGNAILIPATGPSTARKVAQPSLFATGQEGGDNIPDTRSLSSLPNPTVQTVPR
ncbi:hypothetical protein BDV98DRAFT_565923 [Pterulicium gracile]|uniref:Uncharacterized protein n=1 Tax=Pterulicium gracile TaxID=1884261 RepID=A0A5C3QMC5_9AGAR|nr:hypothetical protein BDV98DRAFT_565923 [Pterula gracilis]